MTATDELRRLLDERGVEWKEGDASYSITWHTPDGRPCSAMYWNPSMSVCISKCSPAQAIEATLGRGECEAEVEVVEFSQMQEIHRFTCSECGESFGAEEHGGLFGLVLDKVKLPNYCPNCGRKVVDA